MLFITRLNITCHTDSPETKRFAGAGGTNIKSLFSNLAALTGGALGAQSGLRSVFSPTGLSTDINSSAGHQDPSQKDRMRHDHSQGMNLDGYGAYWLHVPQKKCLERVSPWRQCGAMLHS